MGVPQKLDGYGKTNNKWIIWRYPHDLGTLYIIYYVIYIYIYISYSMYIYIY